MDGLRRFDMALWQFDFYIIPMDNMELDEDILSWRKYNISSVAIDF